jgi:hypothetical protein
MWPGRYREAARLATCSSGVRLGKTKVKRKPKWRQWQNLPILSHLLAPADEGGNSPRLTAGGLLGRLEARA